MAKAPKKKRYYYPYCGVMIGFCLLEGGCVPHETPKHWCKHWRERHPITKVIPQSLYLRSKQ